jgi:hypothetical protein
MRISSACRETLAHNAPNVGGTMYETGEGIGREALLNVRVLLLLLIPFLTSSLPADELTGTWNGTMSVTSPCPGGSPVSFTSPITLGLTQTGTSFYGNLIIHEEPDDPCQGLSSRFTIALPLFGQISGTAVSSSLFVPGGAVVGVNGTVNGTSLSLVLSEEEDEDRTFSATRTSSTPPESQLTGFYEGTHSSTFSGCCRLPLITTGGTVSGNLIQTGTTLTGTLVVTGTKTDDEQGGACTVSDVPPLVVLMTAVVSGNSIAGFIIADDDEQPNDFTATISGNTITGDATGDQCENEAPFSITLTRRSSVPGGGPTIATFTATPASINAGQPVTLAWTTQNAVSVTIDHGPGEQATSGSVTVQPLITTTYTLTALSAGGASATASVTVNVAAGGTPRVVVSAAPAGMVQPAGQGGATDSFAVTNLGDAATTVTLSPSGNFFTAAPASFSLPASASRIVTITGTAQPANSYEGSISISGAGVPGGLTVRVRLLSAAPPAGSVGARADSAREEVASPSGQNASGSVDFTNNGSATLQGIAVSDVPWIIPQGGVISIPPGQTASVSYTIDSAKRPDASSPLGAVTGKISLVFLSGSTTGPIVMADGPGTSTVSVTLVHVARPNVSGGTPPPLNSGEVALLVAGLGNRDTAHGDLLLGNRQSSPVSNVSLFVQGAGAGSQTTTIGQLVPNSAVLFPRVMNTVFSASVPTGSAQVRGSDVTRLSVAAIQSNTASPVGTFSTALPVFRSDRGAAASQMVLLTGLLKLSPIKSDIYVQELSGTAGSFRVEILDRAGNVLSSGSTQSIGAFGFAELLDVVPTQPSFAELRTARITNVSGGNTRLNAYALVTNTTNGDSWLVTDPALDAPGNDTIIVPVLNAGSGTETVIYVTNRTTAPIAATIDERSAGRRRRAVVRGTNDAGPPLRTNEVYPFEVAPQNTSGFFADITSGYMVIRGPAGAISVAARSNRETTNSNVNGSGLPAVQSSDALRSGESKRFAGVDDASAASRARSVPATFRTGLALIETAGSDATVRVTLQFSFSGGSLVSSSGRVSRDFALSAGQFRLIADLGRDVIGSSRDTFGDLRDVIVDVEVVGGGGRVIAVLQAIDNGSGDMIVRTD